MRILDRSQWKRREHFEFYLDFDEPFFGLVREIDCTLAYDAAKREGRSFFAHYLHASMRAVNAQEEFKYRIRDGEVVIFDAIHAASTIGRPDGTFAFSLVEYSPDFDVFSERLQSEIEAVQACSGLRTDIAPTRHDTIHYTAIPWCAFTGLSHPRRFGHGDSCPKIAFGKAESKSGRRIMPVAVHAHHGLVDGIHVSRHFDLFQELMNQ